MINPAERVNKIFANIEAGAKPDALVLGNGTEPHLDASFFYVTGFPYGLFEGSYIIARRDGSLKLLTSTLEEAIARSHSNGIEVEALPRESVPSKLSELAGSDIKSIGINSAELTVRSFDVI